MVQDNSNLTSKQFLGTIIFNNGLVYSLSGKLRKLDKGRYARVCIKKKNYLVHRLVALLFIPNPQNYPIVRHKDNNTFNNDVSNLEWGTLSDNEQDKKRHGTYMTRATKSKLSFENRQEILRLKKQGLSGQKIAVKFNVTRQTINTFLAGKSWNKMEMNI